MSELPNIDDILSRQRVERQRREEQERQEEEATRRHRELLEAFHNVRYCTIASFPSETDFFEEFARRLIGLVRLLSQRGELEGLLDRVRDTSEIAWVNERDARAFVVHLLGVAVGGEQQEVARRLREAIELPFFGRVNEWLRRDLERTFYGTYPLTASVDGVCWPVMMPDEPDPLGTLLQACSCVAHAFEQANPGPFGSPNPARVVNGLWQLVNSVADRLRRTPPTYPDRVLDAEAVRQAVLLVRNWCHQAAANPDDPVEDMRKAIRDERIILDIIGNASSSGFDWQTGINRLWQRWRDLFPLEPPPERPTDCRNYHQASDAVDALVRALSDLNETRKTMSDTPQANLISVEAEPPPRQIPTTLQVDTRQVPLEAPIGTPSPLREAFDAVAEALLQATEMRRSPPNDRLLFEDLARSLSTAWQIARAQYAAAELLLQAVIDDGGNCSFQEALNVVCQVNDAVGHVMLNIVAFDQATAHIQAVPAFDLTEILRGIRRQTSRAASRFPQNAPAPRTAAPASDVVPIPVAEELPSYNVEDQSWHTPLPETKELQTGERISLADKIDIVILTATNPELAAVLRRLDPLPRRRAILKGFVEQETYYLGTIGAYRVAVTKCRMGSLDSGAATLAAEHAQRVWRPRALVMVGIAFGKDPTKHKIADVLVASQVISYEPQRVGEDHTSHRGSITPANTTLLNRFENAPNWSFDRPDGSKCDCHVGPLLSGEKLVDESSFKASLFDRYSQAIGGEMEGVGLAASAVRHGVPWILVKAICDWGDGKKHNKHQLLAAAAAVSLVQHVLSQKDVLHGLDKPNR